MDGGKNPPTKTLKETWQNQIIRLCLKPSTPLDFALGVCPSSIFLDTRTHMSVSPQIHGSEYFTSGDLETCTEYVISDPIAA